MGRQRSSRWLRGREKEQYGVLAAVVRLTRWKHVMYASRSAAFKPRNYIPHFVGSKFVPADPGVCLSSV